MDCNLKTATFKIEIMAPIEEVWKAISTTEGMKSWVGLKIDTDWQVNSPIVMTCYDEKGKIIEYNGKKVIFKGIIEIKKEKKEITYSYPEKRFGIERESYILSEIDTGTTCVTLIQTCTSEQTAKNQEQGQKQVMEILKTRLEEK